jgi:hypothetical protein
MHKGLLTFASIALLLNLAPFGGCSGSFEGIRVRSQAPNIDEAFRKISLAISADGYAFESTDPVKHILTTGWKEMTPLELSEVDRKLANRKVEGRIILQMDARGKLYDIRLTPTVRYGAGTPESAANVHHPLREKWEKMIRQLVELEAREED